MVEIGYAFWVSATKAPQTYVLHTTVLFIVLCTALVLFLHHQWS